VHDAPNPKVAHVLAGVLPDQPGDNHAAVVWSLAEQAAVRCAGYPSLVHAPWVLLALNVLVIAA
jgi:hypothetical protein